MMVLAFLFLGAMLIVGIVYFERATQQREIAALEDETASVQGELLLSAGVEDGYEREVVLPAQILGNDYSIMLAESSVTLTLPDGVSSIRAIPRVTGGFVKGTNRIRKVGGELLLDQPPAT